MFGLLVLLLLASGCDSDDGSRSGGDASGDVGATDVATEDGATDDSGTDTSPDADEDGGNPDCPLYQSFCDGACVPTNTDPDNCGGCGVTCAQDEVCSGGTCTDTCMAGLSVCDRSCVDTQLDNDNCGTCGSACPDGQGCVEGACQETADLGDRAAACADGGPVIDLGESISAERQCSGELAERTFGWAICSCEDIGSTGEIYADAYDSSIGPYVRGGEGGGMASNGVISTNSGVVTTGTIWAADQDNTGMAIRSTQAGQVGQRMHAGSDVRPGDGTTVGGDAFVDGNVDSAFDIGGTLHVPDSATVADSVTYADLQRGPVDVALPCGACAAEDRIPIDTIVQAHSGDNNNNADIGLDADIFAQGADGPSRIDLPCGQFYLSEISDDVTIVTHGNTALYIGGDISTSGKVTITPAPESQLDVFVAGSVQATSGLKLGSPNYPALLRVYVGGPDGFRSTSGSDIAGFLYAVPGGVTTTSGAEVFGGVYAQSLQTTGGASVHFDRLINVVGQDCPGGSDPGEDVCSTQSDTCSTHDDCCAPLVCGVEGTCQLLQCQPLNAECSADDDCCTDTCGGGICVGR